jgi:hypothetical protein
LTIESVSSSAKDAPGKAQAQNAKAKTKQASQLRMIKILLNEERI